MSELRSGRGIHDFSGHLSSRMDPVPGLDLLALMGVEIDVMVHPLQSFLFFLIYPYSIDRQLFIFRGEIPPERLPLVTELLVEALVLWCTICAVPREYHQVHVKVFLPSIWKFIPLERAGKHMEESQNLAYRVMTFPPPEVAFCLLGQGNNIAETSGLLLPIGSGRAPSYNKALDWIHFNYTLDWLVDYVAPDSTDLDFIALSDRKGTLRSGAMASSKFIPQDLNPGVYIKNCPHPGIITSWNRNTVGGGEDTYR